MAGLLDIVTLPIGFLQQTFLYTAICFTVHFLAGPLMTVFVPGFSKLGKGTKVDTSNRLVASLHAIVMTMATMYYWIYMNPSMSLEGYSIDEFQGMAHDAMIGYLVYDTVTNYVIIHATDNIAMAHHALGLITHISARLLDCGPASFYYMMVYVAEGSTAQLHLVWFMYAMGMKEYPSFKVVCFVVLASYFVLRIMWGPYMLFHLNVNKDVWQLNEAGALLFYPNALVLVAFNAINFFWFYKLLTRFLSVSVNKIE